MRNFFSVTFLNYGSGFLCNNSLTLCFLGLMTKVKDKGLTLSRWENFKSCSTGHILI